ncbi:hypothetical protein EDC04DRAFT_2580957, partial [Pisolithus marmoratus]
DMEMAMLADELSKEEITCKIRDDDNGALKEIDNNEGWVDELDDLTEKDWIGLEKSIWPVKLVLVKLQRLAYKIVNLLTIILPAWKEILRDLHMTISLMPRDVQMRWNSTLNLLEYALKH